jgi:hypothetical protein
VKHDEGAHIVWSGDEKTNDKNKSRTTGVRSIEAEKERVITPETKEKMVVQKKEQTRNQPSFFIPDVLAVP